MYYDQKYLNPGFQVHRVMLILPNIIKIKAVFSTFLDYFSNLMLQTRNTFSIKSSEWQFYVFISILEICSSLIL